MASRCPSAEKRDALDTCRRVQTVPAAGVRCRVRTARCCRRRARWQGSSRRVRGHRGGVRSNGEGSYWLGRADLRDLRLARFLDDDVLVAAGIGDGRERRVSRWRSRVVGRCDRMNPLDVYRSPAGIGDSHTSTSPAICAAASQRPSADHDNELNREFEPLSSSPIDCAAERPRVGWMTLAGCRSSAFDVADRDFVGSRAGRKHRNPVNKKGLRNIQRRP